MDSSSSHHLRRRKNPLSLPSVPSEVRNWAALPHDVLLNIFLKLGSCEIMWGAEAVCKAWRHVTIEEPMLWRKIHITAVPEWSSNDIAVRDAVNRSVGQCESFFGPWDDESLLYLAERSPSLKSLHLYLKSLRKNLLWADGASYEVLIEAIKKFPLLEDLEISPPYEHISASERLFESICKARPLLKNLKVRFIMPFDYPFEEAMLEERIDGDIYRTPLMCELRSLVLCNYIYDGLELAAILDNCPLLESLDITGLFVDGTMDAQLQAKCATVKNLNLHLDDSDDEGEEDEYGDNSDKEDEEPTWFSLGMLIQDEDEDGDSSDEEDEDGDSSGEEDCDNEF
ncbi:hypothetical protein U9M48_040285 [Paspalum notatum var. saurae]|uniref:F-box domain-containing protein n=1 Tax=Paspalum notatum var. saurae TaxID=547442 RepID=A0AAQ3XC84_PASNO